MSTRDYVAKDYYAALGVPKDADADTIRKAYRKLARRYHPDANKGDAKAEERFKEVSEAYDVLSDKDKRTEYDQVREAFGGGGLRMPGGGNGAGAGGFDLGDLFGQAGSAAGGLGDLLGGIFTNNRRRSPGTGPHRGPDVTANTSLTFTEAVEGATVPLRLRMQVVCPLCHGSRARPGTTPRVCPTCNGVGQVSTSLGGFGLTEPCRDCQGTGFRVDDPCPNCGGSGHVIEEKTITVRIPGGVSDGQQIRLRGKGAPGLGGGVHGDLLVTVHVSGHPVFGRSGDNLTLTLPVSYPEAVLGADIPVPTLKGGSVTLRIPPGTASGRTFRVRGRGVPHKDGTRGDLLATVNVAVPQRLSGKAREALETLGHEVTEDPRADLVRAVEAAAR